MNVITETKNDVLLITVDGSIDSKTAGDLQQQILEAAADAIKVVMDLTKVTFVSSAGLRVLLMVYRQIKTKNGRVILVGVSEEIREVMSMTGFINFFVIADTVDDAIKLL